MYRYIGFVVLHLNPPTGQSFGISSPASLVTLYHPSARILSHNSVASVPKATDRCQLSIYSVVLHGSSTKILQQAENRMKI